jgi:glutamate racemase
MNEICHTYPTYALLDSGIGGLHLLKELWRQVPGRYFYLADTAHMPYGNKNSATIQKLAKAATTYLQELKPERIIVACHTISSVALPHLAQMETPLVGIVDVVAEAACASTVNGRVGILATAATINSHAHKRALLARNPYLACYEQACPLLASMIEKDPRNPRLPALITSYLIPLLRHKIDTIILGCTHYEAVRSVIAEILGPNTMLIGASEHIVSQVIREHQEEHHGPVSLPPVTPRLLVTGDYEAFVASAGTILGHPVHQWTTPLAPLVSLVPDHRELSFLPPRQEYH